MRFLRSEEHVERWCRRAGLERGVSLALEQAWALGRAWFGDRLASSWRPLSRERAQTILAEVGLTGPFWDLVAPP
jgi:hypothetical protein